MGLLDRFKKKEDNFDDLPYTPDDASLPPLPPAGGMGEMDLPPLPPMPKSIGSDEGHLPPMPSSPKFPPMPVKAQAFPDIDINEDIGDLDSAGMAPRLPERRVRGSDLAPKGIATAPEPVPQPAISKRRAKVFVQLNKYRDIVKTVHNMEERVGDLQTSIRQIRELRTRENEIIESWNNLLTEAKAKIEEVNSKLPGVEDDY